MKTVYLKRLEDTGVQTQGFLETLNFNCKTIERPWKNNQKSISCIPKGEYTVEWTFSFKLMRHTYEIKNVLSRSGIRIHPGNYFFNVEGCIIVGTHFMDLNKDRQLDLINSRETLKRFEETMGKEKFLLIIS